MVNILSSEASLSVFYLALLPLLGSVGWRMEGKCDEMKNLPLILSLFSPLIIAKKKRKKSKWKIYSVWRLSLVSISSARIFIINGKIKQISCAAKLFNNGSKYKGKKLLCVFMYTKVL